MSPPFVIFDFDGVIADTERLHLAALQRALAPRGVTLGAEEYESEYLGSTDHDLLIALAKDRSLAWGVQDIESIVTAKGVVFDAMLDRGSVVFPSAIRCINRLAGLGATLAIASGAFRREIERILDSTELRRTFPVIVGAGEYSAGKPSPEPFLEAARRLGLPASTAVVIEDTPWGLAAAHAAGCATIAITHTYSRSKLAANAVIDSLDEVDASLLRSVRSESST
jgi:beta-phosphoglucomutase-like phosphatase (HAD superfamily)